MPNLSIRRPQTPLGWAGAVCAASGLVLVLLALANVSFAAYFPLVSLWYSASLFLLGLVVLRTAGVELDFFHRAVLVAVWAAAVLYAYWALGRREFIYAWDYVNYILKQTSAEAAFAEGAHAGFAYIFGSFADDYTNFITLFTEFPFCLTDHSGDNYAFAQVFCIVPTLLVMLAGVVIKAGQMLGVHNRFYFFLIGLSWTFTYPFLRMSAMLSQPDWLGLVFAFMIMLLTLDHRFEKLEPVRCVLLFVATAAIILTRRWYLYFVVGYYFSYAVLVIVSSLRRVRAGDRDAISRIKRLVIFGVVCIVAMVILLWPMVSHILSYDYAGRYAYYNVGGMIEEIRYHLMRIGPLNFILIGLGLFFAWKNRLPALPCLAGLQLFVSMVMFTRVQNTGSHQMLLFVPGWLLLFIVGAAALAEGIKKHTALKLCYWAFTIVFALSVRCSPLTVLALPDLVLDAFPPIESTAEFVRLDKLTYDRKDKPQIEAIDDWLDAHLAEGETAYLIPNDMLYNTGHFQYCDLPEIRLDGKLTGGFSVPGTHTFPMQFFEAKYVLTCDPLPQTYVFSGELSHIFKAHFLEVCADSFVQAGSFDMGNGTTFTIWERVAAPTRAEVEGYLAVFADVAATYPELYTDVAEAWLSARGL